MLAGKDDVFTWLVEKLAGKAVIKFAPTWVLAALVIIGAVVWLIKIHVPEANRERANASIDEFAGRVLVSLVWGVFGGFGGGVAWSILARNFAVVESLGGEVGPGIAAITSAVITALVGFAELQQRVTL